MWNNKQTNNNDNKNNTKQNLIPVEREKNTEIFPICENVNAESVDMSFVCFLVLSVCGRKNKPVFHSPSFFLSGFPLLFPPPLPNIKPPQVMIIYLVLNAYVYIIINNIIYMLLATVWH